MAEFKLDIERIKDLYDHKNDSPAAMQKYQEILWLQLQKWVAMRASSWASKVKNNCHAQFEDLMANAAAAICEHAADYDPYKTKPTTYFTPFIDDAMKECTNTRTVQVSNHYVQGAAETEKVLRENGYDGLQDSRVTVKLICQIMDYPTKMANIIWENSRRTFCSLDDPSWIEDSMSSGPEDIYCKNESSKELLEACQALTPLERYMIEMFYIEDIRSTRMIVTQLRKSPKLLDIFSLSPKQVTGKFVEQIKNKAVTKLKSGSETKKNAMASAEIYEQVSQSDFDDFGRIACTI